MRIWCSTEMTEELERVLAVRCRAVSQRKWTISKSSHGGRGLFSTRDILAGELIFIDFPALVGPKSNVNMIGCSVCSEERKPLRSCSKNCHLPVCSDKCETAASHKRECEFLSSLNLDIDEWSPNLYKRLILIRSLWMTKEDRKAVLLLHSNRGTHVDKQISALQNLLNQPMKDQVTWLRHCCGVLDGTAFEVELNNCSLKGLYPLSAMMNHNCVPNTRLSYTGKSEGYLMIVVASKFIPRGGEILTSYCPLLWSTHLRRAFLAHTKHFLCTCERCQDPTEFGSNLAALKCQCGSILLPLTPLNFKSIWKCKSCHTTRNSETMTANQNDLTKPNSDFPESNYCQVQLEVDEIFKATKENSIASINADKLHSLLKSCLRVLHVIDQLNLGNTHFKGRLCQRLEILVNELTKRNVSFNKPEALSYIAIGREIEIEDETSRISATELIQGK